MNGFTAWAYWLGWFPVAPLNMILASFYIVDRFKLSTAGFTPIHTPIAWWTLGISIVGLVLLAIPAIRGLRFGTLFATGAGVPLDDPADVPRDQLDLPPSVVDFGQLTHFRHTDGSGFFASQFNHGWLTLYIAFSFLLTWNVIAMEAAACYIGETKNPDRDAKIAMNLEGAYGLFIYTMIPVAFIIVLGTKALGNAALVDPKTIFVHFASKVFGAGAGSNILNWLIAIMLILALILSALNAITGTARSLHQMATDGQFPRFFQHVNHHGVPDRAMLFNVACSIAVVFLGGAVEIYTFSNVGYLASFIPVLIGYFLLRKYRPNVRRPFKLPEWMKYVALVIAAIYTVIYFYGGPVYASCACNAAGRKTLPYYFIGIGVVLLLLPAMGLPKVRRGQTRGAGELRRPRCQRRSRAASEPVSAAARRRPSPEAVRAGRSSGSCSRPRGARSRMPRSPACFSSPSLAAPACACSASRAFTASRSGCRTLACCRPRREWAEQREIVAKAIKRLQAQRDRGQRARRRHPRRRNGSSTRPRPTAAMRS